jgi:hypothetical protein
MTMSMRMKSGIAALLACGLAVACGEDKGGDDKAAWDKAFSETGGKVATMAAFKPYLDKPKPQKYDPEKRTDLDRAVTFAANETRHAANGASQRIARSKSEAVKAFATPFENVAKTCAEVEGDEAAGKCKEAVSALEKAMEEANSKAKAAGATGSFAKLEPGSIDDAAKKLVADYLMARGPGKAEEKYLEKRRVKDTKGADLAAGCDAAASEAGAMMKTIKAMGNEELHKVAAHHKAAVDGQCNRMKELAGIVEVLEACGKEEGAPEEAECTLACSKAKGRMKHGIPAAPFERLEADYKEVCEKDDKK